APIAAGGGGVDREALFDRLSEFLEHERNVAQVYELGLEKVEDEEQRDRLEEFLGEARGHVEALTEIVRKLGGNPDQLSESAELDRQKARALIEVDAPDDAGLLNYFQTLAMFTLADYMNWRILRRFVN